MQIHYAAKHGDREGVQRPVARGAAADARERCGLIGALLSQAEAGGPDAGRDTRNAPAQ